MSQIVKLPNTGLQDINNFLNSFNDLLSIQIVNFLTDNTLQLIHFRAVKRQQLQRQIKKKNYNKEAKSVITFFPKFLISFLCIFKLVSTSMSVIYYFQYQMTESSYRGLCQEVPKRRCNSKRSIVWGFGGVLVCLFGEKILIVSGKNYHIIFFAATVDVIVLYQIQVSLLFHYRNYHQEQCYKPMSQ